MTLMLLGNVGLVASGGSLILGFTGGGWDRTGAGCWSSSWGWWLS